MKSHLSKWLCNIYELVSLFLKMVPSNLCAKNVVSMVVCYCISFEVDSKVMSLYD